jgi:Ran GTPase-activating protein (RanGAP) involved in mRNA processing and transport
MRNEEINHFQQFKQNLLKNTKKRTFKMSSCGLANASAEVIAHQIIRCNPHFCHFQLAGNNFGDDGLQRICGAICEMDHVVSLDFSMNKLTSRGADTIAHVLLTNQSLIELNLSSGHEAGNNRNRISTKGAFAIANALSQN